MNDKKPVDDPKPGAETTIEEDDQNLDDGPGPKPQTPPPPPPGSPTTP